MSTELEITYVKSAIGYSERQKRTVRALGLRKLHDSVRQPDNPSIRGMIHSIRHLLTFKEVEVDEPATAARPETVAVPASTAQAETVAVPASAASTDTAGAASAPGQEGDIT